MAGSYFTTTDGVSFLPTDHGRGPWDPDACHAGPPTALMARAVEALAPDKHLARMTVEVMRPIPMRGFRVQGEIRRPGRQVTLTEAEIFDDDVIYARAYGLHLRVLDGLEVDSPAVEVPDLAAAVPGPFPIHTPAHDLPGFTDSIEVRYDPSQSQGAGGPTTLWFRALVPILEGEEPSPFQRICPLADSGNGISFNHYLDEVFFLNADLTLSLHRPPAGEWHASRVLSHWHPTGIGSAEAVLFDRSGPVGTAIQNLLLTPVPGA